MGEQNQEEKTFTSSKVELTEEMKSMPIEDLAKKVTTYGYDVVTQKLKELGIDTLGDLLVYNTDEISRSIKSYWSGFSGMRVKIMDMGLLFNDDHKRYEAVGISDEIALIPIKNLELPERLYKKLSWNYIFYLGDLLAIDPYRINGVGEKTIIELKNHLYSLGFSMKNVEPIFKREIIDDYRKKGIQIIQDFLDVDPQTISILYKNGIYTLDDLLRFGQGVFNLERMGPFRQKQLKDAMSAKGISFETSIIPQNEISNEINSPEFVVNRLMTENGEIKKRIDRKKQLLRELEKLTAEKKELQAIEEKLDEEIAIKFNILHNSLAKEEGTSYVRKKV